MPKGVTISSWLGVLPAHSRARMVPPHAFFGEMHRGFWLKAVLRGIATYAFNHVSRVTCNRHAEELGGLSAS